MSDSLSRKSDFSDDRKYKTKRREKNKNTRNTRNSTCQTHRQVTMIRPTKEIIKARGKIKIRGIGNAINRTPSNYAKN